MKSEAEHSFIQQSVQALFFLFLKAAKKKQKKNKDDFLVSLGLNADEPGIKNYKHKYKG